MAELKSDRTVPEPRQTGIKVADLSPELFAAAETCVARLLAQAESQNWLHSGMAVLVNAPENGVDKEVVGPHDRHVFVPRGALTGVARIGMQVGVVAIEGNQPVSNVLAVREAGQTEFKLNRDYVGSLAFLLPHMTEEIGSVLVVGNAFAPLKENGDETNVAQNPLKKLGHFINVLTDRRSAARANSFKALARLIIAGDRDLFNRADPERMSTANVSFPAARPNQAHYTPDDAPSPLPVMPGVYTVQAHADPHGRVYLNGHDGTVEELAALIKADPAFNAEMTIYWNGCNAGSGVFPPAQQLQQLTGAKYVAAADEITSLAGHTNQTSTALLAINYNGGRARVFGAPLPIVPSDRSRATPTTEPPSVLASEDTGVSRPGNQEGPTFERMEP